MGAGYVDAIGFLKTGGFFVSFMSGNSTRMAVDLAKRSGAATLGLGLIAAFVAGVTAGAVVGRTATCRRTATILGMVSLLLAAASATLMVGSFPWGVLLLAFAMGAENTIFAEDGEVRIGVTYMTGTLVKLGKALAAALFGGDPLGFAPYFFLWFGLVVGAGIGAGAYTRFGVAALWAGAGAMASLAVISAVFGLAERQPTMPGPAGRKAR